MYLLCLQITLNNKPKEEDEEEEEDEAAAAEGGAGADRVSCRAVFHLSAFCASCLLSSSLPLFVALSPSSSALYAAHGIKLVSLFTVSFFLYTHSNVPSGTENHLFQLG